MTVLGINRRFANPLVFAFDLFEVNSYFNIVQSVICFSQFFFESFYRFVLFAVDVEFSAVLYNSSLFIIEHKFVRNGNTANCTFFGQSSIAILVKRRQGVAFIVFSIILLIPSTIAVFIYPSTICIFVYFEYGVTFYIKLFLVQFDSVDSFNFVFAFTPVSVIGQLIISVQRHPDNVAWFEVNGFVIVQLGGSFFNDVAVFVGYKQFTIKFEVVRPISLVVRASAVGNSKSVSAHAKYHSRSQCYGKYFFHSLSSS